MPVKKTIAAQVPENKEKGQAALGPATVEVPYGETAKESIELFGDDAVNSNAFANWRVTVQNNIRSALKAGLSQADIQAKLGSAKMGVAQTGAKVDPIQAYMNRFATATPEEQQKMLAELRDRAKAAQSEK